MPRPSNAAAARLYTKRCGECGVINYTDPLKNRARKGGIARVILSQQPGELSMREVGMLGGRPRRLPRSELDAGLPSQFDGGSQAAGTGVQVSILPNEPQGVSARSTPRGTSTTAGRYTGATSSEPSAPVLSSSKRGRL